MPKIIILNKQIYEVLFTLLQTHPCYLTNWICAAARQDVDLFDDHPQAFQDTNTEVQEIEKVQAVYQSLSELQIQNDEICYLLIAIFGGLKTIRNDRRIITNLMVIADKVFQYELAEATSTSPKLDYSLDDMLQNRVECAFLRIHRLIFQSQYQNTALSEQLFECIVKRLYFDRRQFTDGIEGTLKAEGMPN